MENDTAIKLMQEIKENRLKLDSCSKHDFSIDVTPNRTYSKKFRCTKCDGVVDLNEKRWYEKGIKDATDFLKRIYDLEGEN